MKKSISLTTLGIMSAALMGCSNEVQPLTNTEPVVQNVSAQSNQGLNSAMKVVVEMSFSMFDSDKDGLITESDFIKYSVKPEERKAVFKKIDKDGDGKISLADAQSSSKLFASVVSGPSSKESLRTYAQNMFTKADDPNNDRFVNESEFIRFMTNQFSFFLKEGIPGSAVSVALFEAHDKNRDKVLSFSEFEDAFYNIAKGIMKACMLGASTAPPSLPPATPPETPNN